MLQAKTLGALVFAAVAGLGAWWQLSRDDRHKETEAPASPVPAFAGSDVDELTINDASTGSAVHLLRDATGWKVTEPIADGADDRNVDSALRQLSGISVSPRPAASSRESWDKLRIAPAQALSVTLRKAGAQITALHVSLDGKFVRVGDAEEVYPVYGINRAMLARELPMWRDRQVIAFEKAAVKSVSVTTADGRRASADRTPAPPAEQGKPPGSDTWILTAGQQVVGPFDQDVPVGIVARMQNLSAQEFADDKTKADAGLAPPALTVAVVLDDGTSHALELGANADDAHRYVSRADSDRVWLAANTTLDSFARPPLQWRDKTLVDISPNDVARIDVTHAGFRLVAEKSDGAWNVLRPAGLAADNAKLDSIASGMHNLRGTAIATDLPRNAFRNAETIARFTTADRRVVVVTFGQQQDTSWPAKANTRNDVVMVADHMAQRFRVTDDSVAAK